MSDYLLILVEPFSHKIKTYVVENEQDALKIADKKKKRGYDFVIVKRDKNEQGLDEYKLSKKGYVKLYDALNKILFLLAIMLSALFSYLYYKFIHSKN